MTKQINITENIKIVHDEFTKVFFVRKWLSTGFIKNLDSGWRFHLTVRFLGKFIINEEKI